MALNLTEAAAVNDVLRHLIGARRPGDSEPPSRDGAIKALSLLTGRAFAKLGAGYSADSARDNLTALWPGALLDVWMAELHGAEPEPFATEQLARHHVLTEGAWDPGSDLSWRTGRTDETGRSAKILYCNGSHTLSSIWPTRLRFASPDGYAAVKAVASERSCKLCGCTRDEPCGEDGCSWVVDGTLEIDLCTACAWVIARDAIASGLYQLEPTAGDTLFEARGGLIPQPMLTEAEIDALQPLIAEVEAANGDRAKLDEIAERELTQAITALNHDLKLLMKYAAVPVHKIGRREQLAGNADGLRRLREAARDFVRSETPFWSIDAEAGAIITDFVPRLIDNYLMLLRLAATPYRHVLPAQLSLADQARWEEALSADAGAFFVQSPATFTAHPLPAAVEQAASRVRAFLDERTTRAGRPFHNPLITSWHGIELRELDLRALIDALVVSHMEWRVRGDGFVSAQMSELEARRYIADQCKLFTDDEAQQWTLQHCMVGPWVDAEVGQ